MTLLSLYCTNSSKAGKTQTGVEENTVKPRTASQTLCKCQRKQESVPKPLFEEHLGVVLLALGFGARMAALVEFNGF